MPLCVVSVCAYFPGNEPTCARVWVHWFWFVLLHFYNPQLFPLALVFRLRTPDEPPYQGAYLYTTTFPQLSIFSKHLLPELYLELIQTHMTQKPVLRVEVRACRFA